MKKIPCLCFILLAVVLNCSAKRYFVRSAAEFNNCSPFLQGGDIVTIANGNYKNFSVSINTIATKSNPLTIKAETPGKVVFSGVVNEAIFKLSGAYITLSGMLFQECKLVKNNGKSGVLVEMNNSTHCTLVGSRFVKNQSAAQFMPLVIVSGNGLANKVDRCVFESNVDNQDIQVKVNKESCPQQTMITHNLFQHKQKVSWSNGNGGECIQVGQDPVLLGNIEAYTTVKQNTFQDCNAEAEIISNKSSKNTYSKNKFMVNDGELVMRGGHDCVIIDNVFEGGSGGIRINGTGHIVASNKFKDINTPIRLMYGMAKGKIEVGFYVAASQCIISNNIIRNAKTGILIGDSKNADWTGKFDTKRYPSPTMQNIAPFDNQIEGNKISKSVKAIVKIDP